MDTRAEHPAPPAPNPAAPTLLLSTGTLFHLPLAEIARLGREAGFAGLELVMGSPKIAPGPAVSEAHALCPVRAVHAPFRNWSAWGGHKGAWRAAVDLAAGLLAAEDPAAGRPPLPVTLHPPAGTLQDAIQTRWFARAVDLPRLLDAPPGIALSLENLPWTPGAGGLFGRDPFDALLAECQDKGLGLTFDVCHLGVSGRNVLADLERVPAGLIRHVHFSDAAGFAEHLPPGEGALPLGPFLARLGQLGYAGTLSLELDPAHLPLDAAGQGRELARLRAGMERALAGQAPPEWSGRDRAPGLRAQPGMAALG
jgi:sugar phosphate isomerase/epimerase